MQAPAADPAAAAGSEVLVVAAGERLSVVAGEAVGNEAVGGEAVGGEAVGGEAVPGEPLWVEAALDGGVMLPVPGGVVEAPRQPGGHWLATVTRDAAGTTSEVRWVRLVVDADPPRLEIDLEPPPVLRGERLWTAPAARAVARAWDEPAGVARCTVRCGATQVEAQAAGDGERAEAECALPAVAPVVVVASAEDRVGNRFETERRDLWIDAAAPWVSLDVDGWTVAGAVGPVLAPSARLVVGTGDEESGVAAVEMRLDGETVESLGELTTGEHRAEVVAVDAVGNRSPAAALDFGYDAEAPRLEAGWVLADGAPVRLRLRAEDAPAGLAALEWAPLGGGGWNAVPASLAVTLASLDSAGVRRSIEIEIPVAGTAGASGSPVAVPPGGLRLAAVDRVGNRSETSLPWPDSRHGAMEDETTQGSAAGDEGGGR